jgi:hypothetical protein
MVSVFPGNWPGNRCTQNCVFVSKNASIWDGASYLAKLVYNLAIVNGVYQPTYLGATTL